MFTRPDDTQRVADIAECTRSTSMPRPGQDLQSNPKDRQNRFLMDGIEVEAFRLEPPFFTNVLVWRFIFRLRPKLILTRRFQTAVYRIPGWRSLPRR